MKNAHHILIAIGFFFVFACSAMERTDQLTGEDFLLQVEEKVANLIGENFYQKQLETALYLARDFYVANKRADTWESAKDNYKNKFDGDAFYNNWLTVEEFKNYIRENGVSAWSVKEQYASTTCSDGSDGRFPSVFIDATQMTATILGVAFCIVCSITGGDWDALSISGVVLTAEGGLYCLTRGFLLLDGWLTRQRLRNIIVNAPTKAVEYAQGLAERNKEAISKAFEKVANDTQEQIELIDYSR